MHLTETRAEAVNEHSSLLTASTSQSSQGASISTVTNVFTEEHQLTISTEPDAIENPEAKKNKKKDPIDPLSWDGIDATKAIKCCKKKHDNGRSNHCLSNVCPDELMVRRIRIMRADTGGLRKKSEVRLLLDSLLCIDERDPCLQINVHNLPCFV